MSRVLQMAGVTGQPDWSAMTTEQCNVIRKIR